MLYKMVVLNTGQKKMDYSHQLEILSITLYKQLKEEGVKVVRESSNTEFAISTVVNGLVSYINGIPISSKKDAATFLFESINASYESESNEDELGIIADKSTYQTLIWVLRDLNNLLDERYGEENPLLKFDVFLIALLASIGSIQRKSPEKFKIKKQQLLEKIKDTEDPLNLKEFNVFYNKFKSGIGDKRRKFIYEAFRNYFSLEHIVDIEWDEVYESIFGK